jgi:hypothetical protein
MNTLRTGALVKIIDVLGAEVKTVGTYSFFDSYQCTMTSVWCCSQGVATALRIETPYKFWIGLPGFGGGYFFDTMAVPETA